ncbi:hypothetical protein [Bradyrhizobium sp. sBnM-33]|uniref:hypothetical protein n=1 Tax=Bradyrhizobium sp. sBnM-33 TaxID=2831780 RepID=UPI001BCC2B22|nr:hypothetical protein [Bradyrhizobium sp. sBnM-33]WOH50689.1 hypothetical protein RX328_42940 [Bradyrhizobium sp. sBnM-33]
MIAMIATGEIVDITTGDSKDGASNLSGSEGPKRFNFFKTELCLRTAKRFGCSVARSQTDLLDSIGLSESLLSLWLKRGTSAAQRFCCGPAGIVLGT